MSLALVSTAYAGNNLTTGGAVTVTAPTSITSGNLLVAQISSDTNTFTLPSGWTLYQTIAAAAGAGQLVIAYKYATGSEPSTYVFTPSTTAQAILVSIFNFSGANATTPFNGLWYGNETSATQTAGTTTGTGFTPATASIPTTVGCLPLAIFCIDQLSPSNTGNPTSLTSGWTAELLNVIQDTTNYTNISNNNGYTATFAALGPATTNTTTAITASATWGGAYSSFVGVTALLFINPITYGTLTASPSSLTVNGTGTGNAVQVTITETSYTGNFTVSVPTAYQSIISVSTTQTGTYGTSCTVAGPSGTFWVQELATGNFQVNVLGG